MKKTVFLLCILLVCVCSLPVYASDTDTLQELYEESGMAQSAEVLDDTTLTFLYAVGLDPKDVSAWTDADMTVLWEIFAKQIKEKWAAFAGEPQKLGLPSAPKQFLYYFEEDNRPQTNLDRNLEGGMAVSIGRLREDTQYDYKFVCLSHNTLRGAAGGAVLLAELLAAKGYLD